MKKILIYIILFLFIFFILPALLTNKTVETNVGENKIEKKEENINENLKEDNKNEKDDSKNYQYKKYGTIRLLHKNTGTVEEVPIDEYLYHVVSAEMPVNFEKEALKAQAIVARTYTIHKIQNKKHDNADICDDSKCCQAWVSKDVRFSRWEEDKRESNWKKIQESVDETKGKIITYDDKPINAFFHANSGGTTEIPVNVWGGSNLPYLQVVETSGEEGYNQFSSEVKLTKEELLEKLKKKYLDISIDFNKDDEIKILQYTDSNRVKTVKFGNHELAGVETRQILGLRSTNFEIIKEKGNIIFKVKGYGHGVGMSQTGADSMAKKGKNADEIIHHFYKDIEIKDLNEVYKN